MTLSTYHKEKHKKLIYIGILLIMIILIAIFSLVIGLGDNPLLPFIVLMDFFANKIYLDNNKVVEAIILIIRFPRIIMALLVGCALAIAGEVMQASTRNNLASPFTTGIAAASTFGAACAVFGGSTNTLNIVVASFASSVICLIIIYLISLKFGFTANTIILIGIALNYLYSALTECLRFFAKGSQLEAMIQLSFGSLSRAAWENVFVSFIVVSICTILIFQFHFSLDIISVNNDEVSQTLGINPQQIRFITCLLAVFMTATVICFTGVIGFVGIIAPHISRALIGSNHRYGIPFCASIGMALVLAADSIGHFIYPPNDIPVGVVMAIIGIPVFLRVIMKRKANANA